MLGMTVRHQQDCFLSTIPTMGIEEFDPFGNAVTGCRVARVMSGLFVHLDRVDVLVSC